MNKIYSYPFKTDQDWYDFLNCFEERQTVEIMDVTSNAVIDGKFCKAKAYYITGVFSKSWKSLKANNKRYVFQIGEHENIHGHFVNIDITELLAKNNYCPWQKSSFWGSDSCIDSNRSKRIHKPTVKLTNENCWQTLWEMIKGLRKYDGKNLSSMELEKWWNVDDMWWVGPFCIGDLHGLKEFQKYHQSKFLSFIPDRDGSKGINKVIFSEGNKAALMGHPSMTCTHKGEYFGFKPEGKKPRISVMDFWTCRKDKLVDNWCQIDMIDLFRSINEEYRIFIDKALYYNDNTFTND